MADAEIQTTRDLFLWCMSVIYLLAFSSLFVQIPGLYGENGILPAKLVLEHEAESFVDLVSAQPTFLRLLPKVGLDLDTSMDFLCIGGALLAFVAMVSRDQRNCIVFAVLWMFYLSMFQVGQTFLWFQWDILLLEAGFVTVLIAPLNFFGYLDVVWQLPHDGITFWLAKWLLFRQTFASGIAKLSSEQSGWWTLTELNHYYESQHLPTPLAWYLHQLPDWFQRLSVIAVIAIQIPVSLFFFSPYSNQRRFAFYCQCLLSAVMMLSGNHGFYTLLTLTLAISLLDDRWFQSWTGNKLSDQKLAQKHDARLRPGKWVFCLLTYGALLFAIKRLFSLELNFQTLQVECNTAFTADDLSALMRWVTPLTVALGAGSLLAQMVASSNRCLLDKKDNWQKSLVNLAGCVTFGVFAVCVFSISLVPHVSIDKDAKAQLPAKLQEWHSSASKDYLLANPYMFYNRMNDGDDEGRIEVIIEGSNVINGGWREYNFRFKPGNTTSKLPIVAPHQPRLDWQMWFVARGDYESNHWLLNLIYRLLNNQKEVLELMGDSPFPEKAPKYIRCTLYRYHFASNDKSSDRYSSSNWWVREPVGEYLPILSLDEPSLVRYVKDAGLQEVQGKHEGRSASNLLRTVLKKLRSLFGQGNGSVVCLVLVVAGFLLTLLDPSIDLLGLSAVGSGGGSGSAGREPLANGNPYALCDD